MTPIRLCLAPRCGSRAAHRGYCRDHAPPQRLDKVEQKRIYNSKRWKSTRKRQLFEHPLCKCGHIAEEVDHILPLADGGDPYRFDNLQSLCRECHFAKTREENERRRSIMFPQMLGLVILVGPRAVGKSTIRDALVEQLQCSGASPDDYEDRWRGVARMLWRNDFAVVECCRIPKSLLRCIGRTSTVIALRPPADSEWRRRMTECGFDADSIERYFREARDRALSFDGEVTADAEFTTDREPAAVAREVTELAGWPRGRVGTTVGAA